MTTWLRSIAPTCCALLMSCNALVGVHDLAISSDDAGDEKSEPDAAVPIADASDADSSLGARPKTPKNDGRDDGALEAEEAPETGDNEETDENSGDEDGTVIGEDAGRTFDATSNDGSSPASDAGDAGRPLDAEADDSNHPGVEAGRPSDTGINESSSPIVDAGEGG